MSHSSSILCKPTPSNSRPTGEVTLSLHLFHLRQLSGFMVLTTNYYSITSGTVACNHQCRRRQTRRGKHMSPCCCTGCRHSPNADANPLNYHVCLYRSTQTTSAINLLQPEEEQSTKKTRCKIWEELDSHNDVIVAAARIGKRDHSSMVATPTLPNPTRLGAGMKGNIKR